MKPTKRSEVCNKLKITMRLFERSSYTLSLFIHEFSIYIYIYIYIIKRKVGNSSRGQPEGSFSIATTPRYRVGRYSFPWIIPLYAWSIPYKAECWARRHQVPFWLDLGLNPGFSDLWQTLNPLDQYIHKYMCVCVCVCVWDKCLCVCMCVIEKVSEYYIIKELFLILIIFHWLYFIIQFGWALNYSG